MWSEPEIARYTIGSPAPAPRTWQRVLAYLGHWHLLGFGDWAVEENASGRYIGELGFADFKRDVQPSIAGIPELAQLEGARTVCIISQDNHASLRVAEKLGYREFTRTMHEGEAEIFLDRNRT